MLKQTFQFLLLILMATIIWFIGPFIAIDGISFFQSVAVRLTFILLLAFSWGLYYFLLCIQRDISKRDNHEPLSKKTCDEADYDEPSAVLQRHFQQVKAYYKQLTPGFLPGILRGILPGIFSRSPLRRICVHLVMGTRASGKSLLMQRGTLDMKSIPAPQQQAINLTSSKKSVRDGIIEHHDAHGDLGSNLNDISDNSTNHREPIDISHWYIKDNHIFLDTPGDYATSEVDTRTQTPWKKLINLLHGNRKKFPITSIIMTINIAELAMQQSQQSKLHIHLLKQRILELRKLLGKPLPLYILFTKCDLIKGFSEYFDNLTRDERFAALGITLKGDDDSGVNTHASTNESMTDAFIKDFNALLQQMNAQVITRLHQEHNPKKRNLIREFPLQLDQLKEVIANVIYQLAEKNSYSHSAKPKAVYFTSSEQKGSPIDRLDTILNNTFGLSENTSTQLAQQSDTDNKAYFINQLFHHIMNEASPDKFASAINHSDGKLTCLPGYSAWKKRGVIGTGVAVVLISTLFIVDNFKNNLIQLNKRSTPIQANNRNIVTGHTPTVPKQTQRLKQFIPQLTHAIEAKLEAKNLPLSQIYDDLKGYLMLANPSQLQPDFLMSWIKKNTNINQDAKLALITLLNQYGEKQRGILPKLTLIQHARHILNELPKQYLAYLILKSNIETKAQRPLEISFINQKVTIPYFYTARGLQTLFLNNYKAAVIATVNGNWVIGDRAHTNSKTISETTEQLVTLYTTDYANWWVSKFYNLKFPAPTSLGQMSATLNQFTASDIGLVNLLQHFLNNTDPNRILPFGVKGRVINPTIASIRTSLKTQFGNHFQSLNKIDPNGLQSALIQFESFINAINQANNSNAAAFAIAKQQFVTPNNHGILNGFKQYVKNLPDTISNNLTSMVKASWDTIMIQAKNYIKQQWQKTVVPEYNNNIANRYPIYHSAVADIDLNAFARFFGNEGILNGFFNTYLKAFINTQQSQWQWKKVDGRSLLLSPDLFQLFERGRIITNMFFHNNNNKINLRFTLQQTAMMPIIRSINLVMNGQSLMDERGSKNISTFIWPGNSESQFSDIMMTQINGQHTTTTLNGPWGWFRLLDRSQLQPTQDPRKFKVTFDIDGNEAKYQLVTKDQINPFIPDIIGSFRIPESLM